KLDPKVYPIKDDQEFILKLLIDKKVLLVQGTGFNWKNPDNIRIVFLPNEDDLKESINRIGNYLENFKKNTVN
ncbi:MAG: aminotransferase, partial [Candidatus Methylopumilus sp.]|nr:aminotransferase [Candidatus Methylopumilus sp.]